MVLLNSDWVHRFTRKVGLNYRRLTHKILKNPHDVELDVVEFLGKIHNLRVDVPADLIVTIDEQAAFFDNIPLYSYELRGIKHPGMKVSSEYK